MIVNRKGRQPNCVRGISHEQRREIHVFLQGAVYCWCQQHKKKPFSLSVLVGDNWHSTPLMALYFNRNKGRTDKKAKEQAGKDAGHRLNAMLDDCNEKRKFMRRKPVKPGGYENSAEYYWLGK